MAITGVCLVLFVTFHVVMNAVCILWPAAYNDVCAFLGANWYALVASAGLALLFIIHICYALWLTIQNRKARGNDQYAVTSLPPQVEWSSKNMLVLGLVIVAFLCVHMYQFWAKMQLQELLGTEATVNGVAAAPEFGTLFIQAAFSQIWVCIVYIIGFIALWFHLNHGFWSMFHTVGWDNNIWICRLKTIGCWWTTIVVALFVIEALVFTYNASNDKYFTDPELQEQYAEHWAKQIENLDMESVYNDLNLQIQSGAISMQDAQVRMMDEYYKMLTPIVNAMMAQCPDTKNPQLQQILQQYSQLEMARQMHHGPDGHDLDGASVPEADPYGVSLDETEIEDEVNNSEN